jgi:porin
LIQGTWEPFLRIGYADKGGAPWDWSVSTGVGYYLREHDLLAVGFNWGRPSEDTFGPNLDDQITVELFYRLQLGAHLTVTPDVQVLVNPALNPDEDVLAVFGVRARITF